MRRPDERQDDDGKAAPRSEERIPLAGIPAVPPPLRARLRFAARCARSWGTTQPGTVDLLGARIDYPNQSHALFLVPMIRLDDAVAYLDTLDPAAEEDPEGNGLAVEGRTEVRRIGAALNTTFHAIDAAAEAGVDLLLAHHAPWSQIDLHLREEKLARLRELGISLYVAHEALDRAPGFGVADTLARLLGVAIEHRIVDDFGVVGTAEDATLEAWAARAAEVLGERIRAWPNAGRVGRVALVPGGGGRTDWLQQAREAGCDTYLSGEGTLFTELFARETGMSLVLASHHATEFPGICALAERAAGELGIPWTPLPEAAHLAGGGPGAIELSRPEGSPRR